MFKILLTTVQATAVNFFQDLLTPDGFVSTLCVSGAQWGHANWNVRVWNRERFIVGSRKATVGLCPRKSWAPRRVLAKHFYKSDGAVTGYVISLCTILWLGDGAWTGWYHRGRSLGSRRPEAVSQVKQLPSFIWWGVFTSARQLRKCASNAVIWVFPRGAAAEDGPVASCLVTASPGPGSWRDWKSGDQCSWEPCFLVLCPRACSFYLHTQRQLPC